MYIPMMNLVFILELLHKWHLLELELNYVN